MNKPQKSVSKKQKIIGNLIVLTLVLLIAYATYRLVKEPTKTEMPNDFSYRVINDNSDRYKNSLIIEINRRLTIEQLSHLGKLIYESKPEMDRFYIGYLLPGMRLGSGSWAITNFEKGKNVDVEILGLTDEDALKLEAKTQKLVANSIGAWKGSELSKSNYVLVDSAGFKLFKYVFPAYTLQDTVDIKNLDGETMISNSNWLGRAHYKINVVDDLVYYDETGKPFQTYTAIR